MEYGPACPQQPVTHLPSDLPIETVNYLTIWLLNEITSAEDCAFISSPAQCRRMIMIDDIGLTVNVITPPDATPELRLPVVVVSFEVLLPIPISFYQ